MENFTILDKRNVQLPLSKSAQFFDSKLEINSSGFESFSGLDNSLFGDEDTVEEFTFVLGSDLADLGDLSARKRDIAVVDAFEDQFVLYFSRELNSSAWLHNDLLDVATTEEVLDLN